MHVQVIGLAPTRPVVQQAAPLTASKPGTAAENLLALHSPEPTARLRPATRTASAEQVPLSDLANLCVQGSGGCNDCGTATRTQVIHHDVFSTSGRMRLTAKLLPECDMLLAHRRMQQQPGR